jgi:hypothetical protein
LRIVQKLIGCFSGQKSEIIALKISVEFTILIRVHIIILMDWIGLAKDRNRWRWRWRAKYSFVEN